MRSARRLLLLAVVATAVMAVPASSASATTTFDGQCIIEARIHWDPPLKITPVERNWWFDTIEPSRCDGTLDGQPYSGFVTAHAEGVGTFACDVADARGGRGWVDFGDGRRIDYAIDAAGVFRVIPITLTGDDGGTAGGYTQFWTTYGPTGITGCLPDAPGVPSAHFDAFIQTAPGGISG